MCVFWFVVTTHLRTFFPAKAYDPPYFWKRLDIQFVDGVYGSNWYSNHKIKKQEHIGNKMSIHLGMPRLRQLRIKIGNYDII